MTAAPGAVFVSAADAGYARCLYQLLRSAERHGAVQGHAWAVYDLGLGAGRCRLARRFPWVAWREVDFAALPPHLPPARGTYAWKPHVVRDAAREFARPVVWLDSATVLKAPPAPILDVLREHGVWVLRGQASLAERCEPAVLRALGVPDRLWGERECVATVLGLDPARPEIAVLLDRWHAAAMDPELILPSRRTIPRHMHDQALLSALLLPIMTARRSGYPVMDIDISSGNPVRYLSTRNKLPPWVPRWADPAARAYYAGWKAADQAMIRRRAAREGRKAEAGVEQDPT